MRVRRTMCAATVAAGLAFGVGTDKRWSAGAERNRRSGRRGRRPVAGAHQDQHEQPAGQRSAGGRAVARASPRSGSRVEVLPTPTPGKAHLIARLRAANPTEKPLLLAGHADVVGVERELWNVDPFGGLVRGGDIIGRGSMDFKGGLAAWRPGGLHGRGHAARPLQGYAQPRRDPPRRSRRGGRRLRHVLACGEPLAQDRGRNIAQRWLGARGSRRDAPSDGGLPRWTRIPSR